jgi:hypothetical protein
MTHEDARSGTTLSWPNAAGAGAGCHGFFIARAGRGQGRGRCLSRRGRVHIWPPTDCAHRQPDAISAY